MASLPVSPRNMSCQSMASGSASPYVVVPLAHMYHTSSLVGFRFSWTSLIATCTWPPAGTSTLSTRIEARSPWSSLYLRVTVSALCVMSTGESSLNPYTWMTGQSKSKTPICPSLLPPSALALRNCPASAKKDSAPEPPYPVGAVTPAGM